MKKNYYVVVDMIQGFINEGPLSDPHINRITPTIIELIKNQNKEDVLFVIDSHEEDAIEFQAFPPHCLKESFQSQIIDDLKPYVNHVVYKNSTNAFHCIETTTYQPYDNIVLVGCCSDICILHYALCLKTYFNQMNLDKQVIVIEDATATFTAPHHHAVEFHEMAMTLMRQTGISVLESKDLS